MNGTAAVRQLLAGNATLTALVPATRITAGYLPQGAALPAISITDVSGIDMQTHDEPGQRFTTDRVQITVLAATYPSMVAVLNAAKAAIDAKAPTVSGLSNVVVRTDGQGPYFMDEAATIHMRSQDVKVSYSH